MYELKGCGLRNARDISYANIKKNLLVRSEALNKLTPEEAKILAEKYNIKIVIDLRTDEENKKKDIEIPNAKYYHIPLISHQEFGLSHEKNADKDMVKQKRIPDLKVLYPYLVKEDKSGPWKQIFDILINNEEGAILWHCTAGKDRCGIVSAIIEYALGLSDEEVMYDYLYTNKHKVFPVRYRILSWFLFKHEVRRRFRNIFIAKKEYLESALNYIKDVYGNIETFLYEVCGVSDDDLDTLRDKYTEEEARI